MPHWRQLLPEPVMTQSTDAYICITRLHRANTMSSLDQTIYRKVTHAPKLKPLWPHAPICRHRTLSPLVRLMGCCLIGAQLLTKPMPNYCHKVFSKPWLISFFIQQNAFGDILCTTADIQFRPQWASCQIRKIEGCACAGNAGNVFPATAG